MGMFMPAIRANSSTSALALLVARVLTDHEHGAVATHDLALLAHGLDRRSDLHAPRSTFLYVRTGAGPRSRPCAASHRRLAGEFRPAEGLRPRHERAFGLRQGARG